MAWLLVEDDGDIRTVVAMMMTVWGENPITFPDGKTAWTWLDSVENGSFHGDLPDLALMDIRMPGYTGDQIAARIRRTDHIKDIPIVLMTAFSLTETEVELLRERAGIDHLLNKPLPDMDAFRALLYNIRDEKRARLAAAPQQAGNGSESQQVKAEPGEGVQVASDVMTSTEPVAAKQAETAPPPTMVDKPAGVPAVQNATIAPSTPSEAEKRADVPLKALPAENTTGTPPTPNVTVDSNIKPVTKKRLQKMPELPSVGNTVQVPPNVPNAEPPGKDSSPVDATNNVERTQGNKAP